MKKLKDAQPAKGKYFVALNGDFTMSDVYFHSDSGYAEIGDIDFYGLGNVPKERILDEQFLLRDGYMYFVEIADENKK